MTNEQFYKPYLYMRDGIYYCGYRCQGPEFHSSARYPELAYGLWKNANEIRIAIANLEAHARHATMQAKIHANNILRSNFGL
jgi:hypothetical protein